MSVRKKRGRARKKQKPKLSKEQRSLARRQNALHKSIVNIFKAMGFAHLRTDGKHKSFNGQKGEFDNIFLYKNIILSVEETVSSSDKEHLKGKKFFYDKFSGDISQVILWLKKEFPEDFSTVEEYTPYQYKFFYIYACSESIDKDTKELFPEFKFIDSQSLKYFEKVSACLKRTSIYELYKFLGLSLQDIGNAESHTSVKEINASIILPESASGFPPGIQVVTFLMKAKELMDCAYVLRKDSWDDTLDLYQRLIEKEKVESIRSFLASKERTFVDNIIVSLPYDVSFSTNDTTGARKHISSIFQYTSISNIRITIPYKINSIGIIDGQHRVFGHYEGNDEHESKISALRDKRHLLVTGLFFDVKQFSEAKRRKFEGELFLQINRSQKKVDKALLQHIESLNEPLSSVGIANKVLYDLNARSPFNKMFVLSSLEKGGIKTPTILQYGIQDLVEIDESKYNLYRYWKAANPGIDIQGANGEYESFIKYCSTNISVYFGAVKASFPSDWDLKNKKSRLLSVSPIVAFCIAFRKSLEKFDGPKDFEFYKEKISKLDVDFEFKPFPYTSSQWNALVSKIEAECWEAS